MTRPPTSSCSSEERDGLKKGPWTPDEDQKLVAYIQERGHGSWRSLPLNAGLQRCGKSCRLRWTNYLRPDIKRGRFSQEEDQMIVHLHAILGNRWSAIASHIPRRTDNEIKNYWNTHLKKRLVHMGIDPVTNESTNVEDFDAMDDLLPGLRPVVSSNLTHMSQWENARAEAEARLSQQSSLTSSSHEFNVIPKNLAVTPLSTSFMSSWKSQVAETLRPNFGVVEVEKTPVNLQTFLQEWDSSLQPQLKTFSGYEPRIEVPDLCSGTSSEVVSPCETPQPCLNYILPSSAQITERLLASRYIINNNNNNNNNTFPLQSDSQASSFNFTGEVPGEATTGFSPTSTSLHGHDHDSSYTNSPCVSSNTGDSFELLSQSFQGLNELQCSSRGSFRIFPQAEGVLSFWSRQHEAMADALQPEPGCYFLPELPPKPSFSVPMVNPVGVPNNIPIPQFDFLC